MAGGSEICPVTGRQRLRDQLGAWSGVKNRRGKINSPTFAYQTVYKKDPPEFLSGRSGASTKMWRGKDVDKALKDVWLTRLNSLPVEIRSTEAGKNAMRPAFVVFRMPPGKDDLHKKIVSKLNNTPGIHANADVGMEGRPRICVAGRVWQGQPGWDLWWSKLPDEIRRAYQVVVTEGHTKKAARTYKRRKQRQDLERTQDMLDAVKKLKAHKRRVMKKHGNVEEVANIFKGQRFSDEDVKLGPKNTGWKTIDKETQTTDSGMVIEKTTRIRSFGRLKKVAFLRGFEDELEKSGMTLIEKLVGAGVLGTGAVVGGHAIYKHLKKRRQKKQERRYNKRIDKDLKELLRLEKKGQTKKASFLAKFAAGVLAKMVVEPTPKKSQLLKENPFLRLQAKRRLVSGRKRLDVAETPKAKGLMSGRAQFAHLTRKKEAS